MANLIAIVGQSGDGKSTSIGKCEELKIKGLDPKDTYIINVSGKPLPIKGWRALWNKENKNYKETSDADEIVKTLYAIEKVPNYKNIVIDDAQYLMAFAFMDRTKIKG